LELVDGFSGKLRMLVPVFPGCGDGDPGCWG
jgi:hypothetical protein